MRGKCKKRNKRIPDGTLRIKTGFLLFPLCIKGEWRWLEKASYKQISRRMWDVTCGHEWIEWNYVEWVND